MKPRPVTLPTGMIVDAARVNAVDRKGERIWLYFCDDSALTVLAPDEVTTERVAALIWPPDPAPNSHPPGVYQVHGLPDVTQPQMNAMMKWGEETGYFSPAGRPDRIIGGVESCYPGGVAGFILDFDPETATVLCGRCKLPILGGLCACNHDATADVLAGGEA